MAPTPEELFSDRRGGVAVAERFEEYKADLRKAFAEAETSRNVLVPRVGLIKMGDPQRVERGLAAIDETLAKSLTADQLTAVRATLEGLTSDLRKDWQASFPESGTMTLPTQLAPIDLEAPSKKLVPRQTPLVNTVPRNNSGMGSALQFRRILGWTNSGVGGVPDLMPFLASEFPSSQSTTNLPQFGGYASTAGTPASGGLGLRRGQRITYAADSKTISYTELSVSDQVTWKAYYIGQGYEDIRQLSATVLLWAHKMGEERALLYGRGTTGNGYKGPIAAPGAFTAVGASTGGTIPAGTYSVVLTAIGGGGESAASAVVTTAAITGTGTITITFPAMPAGGMGWNVYVFTATTGAFFYQQTVPPGTASIVLTSYATGTATIPQNAGDASANPNGYDGFLTILLDPTQSGYVAQLVAAATAAATLNSVGGNTLIGGTAPTAVGDGPWQTMFQALYGSSTDPGNYALQSGAPSWPWTGGTAYGQKLLADPDVVYVDGTIRKAMGDFVRKAAGGSTAYRLVIENDVATGGAKVGAIVNGIANQVTGKMVDFDVHPYMPPGVSFAWSKTLPVPDSEVSNTFEVRNVQDYLLKPWTDIQFTWDASTYQLGSFVPYAPAWSGAIAGLLA